MASTHRKQLELVFQNSAGKDVVLSVISPKDNLTKAQAEALANTVIQKNIFTTIGGELKTYTGARIRVLDVTTLA